jgi:hypothetical protein
VLEAIISNFAAGYETTGIAVLSASRRAIAVSGMTGTVGLILKHSDNIDRSLLW